MAVVDLSKRITDDLDTFNKNRLSDASYIFISPRPKKVDSNTTADITVGGDLYDTARGAQYAIPSGYILQPGQAVVVITRERLSLPGNVAGMIFGKGSRIFEGIFISPGKINPGHDDFLRIGIFNGGKKGIELKDGFEIGSCLFVQLESYWDGIKTVLTPPNPTAPLNPWKKALDWMQNKLNENSIRFITSVIGLVGVLIAFLGAIIGFVAIIVKILKGLQ